MLRFVDANTLAARNAGESQSPRHHGSVAGCTTAGRQNTLGDQHTMDIVRARLWPYQDDSYACLTHLFSTICIEDGFATGSSRRSIEALCQQAPLLLSLLFQVLIKARQQQLIHLVGISTFDRLFLCNQAFFDHIYENFDGSRSAALA